MFKIAIGTQLLQTEVPCPLKPSEHYFCVKNKFTLFKPAVDPRGFQTEIQICPGPGWQYERQQQPELRAGSDSCRPGGTQRHAQGHGSCPSEPRRPQQGHEVSRSTAAARPRTGRTPTNPQFQLTHEPLNPRKDFF